MSNQLMTLDNLRNSLVSVMPEVESVLPPHIPVKKFMRTVMGAAQRNPDVLKCTPDSVLLACQLAAQDGLILDGREAALVIFNKKSGNGWVQEAQYQPMIAGALKKLRNSGQLAKIDAITVHRNDPFSYNPAVDSVPNHDPDWFGVKGPRGELVGVYAVALLKDGTTVVEIMPKDQIEEIRSVSKSGCDKNTGEPAGIWKKWYGEKARVAVLKRLCKRLPSSADIDQMWDHDNRDYDLDPDVGDLPKAAKHQQPKTVDDINAALENVDIGTGEILEGAVEPVYDNQTAAQDQTVAQDQTADQGQTFDDPI